MKSRISFTIRTLLVVLPMALFGQTDSYQPASFSKPLYFDISPPLRSMARIDPVKARKGAEEDRGLEENEIPNETDLREIRPRLIEQVPVDDPVVQRMNGDFSPFTLTPVQNFDGVTNLNSVYPPDTQGDVGGDYYIQNVNLNFAIYFKNGTLVYGPAALSTIWAGIPAPWNGTNNGDPVVLYDQAADRWIISQFSLPNSTQYAELIAISQTSDPTGSWYRYVFQYGNKMPDYPKLGVWHDGYYMSANQFISGSSWGGVGASAFERTKMLAGDPTAQMVYFDLGAAGNPESMLPSDWDGTTPPIANEPNYFTFFDDWSSASNDYLRIWSFHVDWTTPANSTFTETAVLTAAPFTSSLCAAYRGRCVPQPFTSIKLESLSDRLMFRLQYRNFGTHRAMVTNHSVNVGSGQAGVRWYELRNTGSGWSVYQQGTYSPDTNNRWMGSIAMNGNGDIALGYSVSDSSVYPTIRYTGRLAGDALGTMTVAEQTIINGTGSQTGSSARWGDYSMMSVDPTDDQTFWFTTEYVQTTGSVNWKTRIASFSFTSSAPVANFVADNISPLPNTTVNLYDLSTGEPTSWSWTITPSTYTFVSGTSGTSKNPKVQFSDNGSYTITLLATNASGSNSKTRTSYIHVGTPGLWTGNTSTDWSTASNWSNYVVPLSTTSITIPTSASNWPVVTGDLTVGASCQNITITGNGELTVNGKLTINAGYSVSFTGAGKIRVGGDWANYGNLNAGTGTLEFFGSGAGKITGGINRGAYLANYTRSTFTVGMTPLSGGTAGPTGDDSQVDVNIGFTFSMAGVNYTQARINCNGWISLNLTGSTSTAYDNSLLFSSGVPNATLGAWWDDLYDDATSTVSYKTEGSAPSRVFTAEWYRVLPYYTGATARISFQVKLYETSNVIEYHYGSVEAGTHSGSEGASIGLEDATGGSTHFIEATTGSITTGITNLISTTQWPAANYRFTPPPAKETFYNLTNGKSAGATMTIQPDIIVNGSLIMLP